MPSPDILDIATISNCPYKVELNNPEKEGEFVQVPLYYAPSEQPISKDKKVAIIDWSLYKEMTPFLSDILAFNEEILDRFLLELGSADRVEDVTNPGILNITYSKEDPSVEANFRRSVESAIKVRKDLQRFQDQGNKVVFNCRDRRKENLSGTLQHMIKAGIRPDLVVAHHDASVYQDQRPNIDLKVNSQFIGINEEDSIPVITMNYNWQSFIGSDPGQRIVETESGSSYNEDYSKIYSDHYAISAVENFFKSSNDQVLAVVPSEEYPISNKKAKDA